MIIDWTYGAIAQLQGYYTTAIAINNSSIPPAEVIVIGCLTVSIGNISPGVEFDSGQPSIKFAGRCDT